MTPILAFAFLTPWLMAAGAAATSIPIIIHLLNKRKFRIVVWAAMEWLLAAQRRNARRLKFQRWLLLALRCLAILIIAGGIAQLILKSTALGTFLGEQRAVVFLWDDSYSMGYTQDAAGAEPTAFDKSKRLLVDYLGSLKAGDNVLVLRTSTLAAGDDPGKPTPDFPSVIAQINAAKPSDGATDLPAAFDRARTVLTELEKSTRSRQLLLVTDFSSSSIHDPQHAGERQAAPRIEGADGQRLKKAAQAAVAHATDFRLIDVGAESQVNIAITGLASHRPAVVAGTPTLLDLQVFNASDRPLLDLPVNLLVDGVPMQTTRLGKIEPGAYQTTQVALTLPTAGRHLVEARLAAPDLLPVDDTRRLMLNVRKEIPVLLVDGSPGDGGRTSSGSTVYLQAAYGLAVEGKPGGLFAPRVITELELPTTPLGNYDVIVLSDTAEPAPAMRESLQKFVQQGGLLMIFPGGHTNPQRLNETLGENGLKLLPATLGQPARMDAQSDGWSFAPEGFQKNPVMQVFAGDYRAGREVGLLTVQTTQYIKLGVPADGSSEVILRYADKQGGTGGAPGDAAVVLKRGIGADPAAGLPGGTVVLFASSADMSWNTWGGKASFLPFVHELTFYGMPRGTLGTGAGLTLDVGTPLKLPGDAAPAGPWTGPRSTTFSVSQQITGGRAALAGPPLLYAGTYGPATGDQRPVIAVNPDASEADVRHVPAAQMIAALGADPRALTPASALHEFRNASAQSEGSWFGPSLIAAALVLFLLEAVLALAFSVYR